MSVWVNYSRFFEPQFCHWEMGLYQRLGSEDFFKQALYLRLLSGQAARLHPIPVDVGQSQGPSVCMETHHGSQFPYGQALAPFAPCRELQIMLGEFKGAWCLPNLTQGCRREARGAVVCRGSRCQTGKAEVCVSLVSSGVPPLPSLSFPEREEDGRGRAEPRPLRDHCWGSCVQARPPGVKW